MAHSVLKVLATIGASVAVVVQAQTLPTPADLPAYEAGEVAASETLVEAVPAPAQMSAPMAYDPLQPIAADALSLTGCGPAITESSGTWLRRGLWYADLDAVVMARTWDSNGATLIEEYDAPVNQVIITVGVVPFVDVTPIQSQSLGESSPGYDGSARLALGRFLFRDQTNRDHTFEFVTFGGAEWDERLGAVAQLTAINEGLGPGQRQSGGDQRGLHVPQAIDGNGPLDQDDLQGFNSFDRANTMDIEYASRFHSWEWNYNVAQRMRKDRMELLPSGEWVRRASPGITWDYTAGFRYFDVEERLDWFATDIDSIDPTEGQTAGDTDGAYNIKTSNNLFGLQLGAGMTYETDRWNVTVGTKHGFAINDARATTALTYNDPDGVAAIALNNYTTDLHENSLAYMATGSILARYHLRPNISLRVGWEFMYVTGLALAPNQADFNPSVQQLSTTGDAFYHGVSFGSEFYW